MSQNTICPNCAGQVAPFDYVCDYCGNVIFENVKTTDNLNEGTLSFDDGMGIVKENLNALHDIPKPGFGKTIKSALRVLFALYTFGIVLIFWRRPKKRFNKDVYDKLKLIILRNISFLKISSKGSNDLMARIKVYEDELLTVDKQIKQGVLTKTIAYIVVFGLFISWFVYVLNSEPKTYSTYKVTPYDSIAQGNLFNHVKIVPDTCLIKHGAPGKGYRWEVEVKLNLHKLENASSNEPKYTVNLLLTDDKGLPISGFEPGVLSTESQKLFRTQITNQIDKVDYYLFLIKNNIDRSEYRDTIPVNAVKFIIRADTINGL